MANPHLGEVSFKSGDQEYTLSFSINVLCALDEALGVDNAIDKVFAIGAATPKQYRTAFFLTVNEHHPEIADEKQAGRLVIPGEMIRLLAKAIHLAYPPPEAGAGGGGRPQSGAGQENTGTGLAS